MTESAPAIVRELHSREQFGIAVRDRGLALDMFHHPYAYAAHYGIGRNTTRESPTTELMVTL